MFSKDSRQRFADASDRQQTRREGDMRELVKWIRDNDINLKELKAKKVVNKFLVQRNMLSIWNSWTFDQQYYRASKALKMSISKDTCLTADQVELAVTFKIL